MVNQEFLVLVGLSDKELAHIIPLTSHMTHTDTVFDMLILFVESALSMVSRVLLGGAKNLLVGLLTL